MDACRISVGGVGRSEGGQKKGGHVEQGAVQNLVVKGGKKVRNEAGIKKMLVQKKRRKRKV